MQRTPDKMMRGSVRLPIVILCDDHPEYDPATYGYPLYECVVCMEAWDLWKKRKGVVEK